jgi:glutamate racemase
MIKKKRDPRPIGVFDSGVGGLTVVKELMNELPHQSIIYFGDTARVPYGSKSKEAIKRFSLEITHFLLRNDVKAIIVACNSASAVALEELKIVSPVPVYGVIDAGINVALRETRNKKIGVIGTKATIRSESHKINIKSKEPSVEISTKACPLFVPLIEEGMFDNHITREVVKDYLTEFKTAKIDTMILGCTHYPLLNRVIREFLGPSVMLIDPAKELVKKIKLEFESYGKEKKLNDEPIEVKYEFFVSDVPDDFLKASGSFIHLEPTSVKKIFLDELEYKQVLQAEIKVSPQVN